VDAVTRISPRYCDNSQAPGNGHRPGPDRGGPAAAGMASGTTNCRRPDARKGQLTIPTVRFIGPTPAVEVDRESDTMTAVDQLELMATLTRPRSGAGE
jgi:hypothetical protein